MNTRLIRALGRPLAVALLCLGVTAPAAAQVPTAGLDAARKTVEAWFAGYEFVPGPAHIKAVGPALEPALVSVALDPSRDLLVRARAVSTLVHTPGDLAEQALVQILEAPEAEGLLKRKAVRVLADAWGERHLGLITNVFMEARADRRLREACAWAIRGLGAAGYATRDLLLRSEKDPVVRGLLLETKAIK